MAVKVSINGFGRIGRLVLRAACEAGRDDLQFVTINDLGSVEANAHLFRYDSVHGRFPGEVTVEGDTITIDADRRLLEVKIADAEMAERRARWQAPKPRYTTGVLAKYAKLVSSASRGAVTD